MASSTRASSLERRAPLDDINQHICEILEAGLGVEEALRRLFATLTVWESRALHGRLINARVDDTTAQRFGGLLPEQRQRLREYLAACRDRTAITRCAIL